MNKRSASISLFLWLACLSFLPSFAHAKGKKEMLRGICFCSSLFSTTPHKPLLDFVKSNRINLVTIDFFVLSYNYDRTDFAGISRFIKKLKKLKVTVMADYRVCTSPVGKSFRGVSPDMCLSDKRIRKSMIAWGLHILKKVTGIDMFTIYNPLPAFERDKECPKCRKTGDRKLLELFFSEWSKTIRKAHPKIKLGAVFPASAGLYRALSSHLDFLSPFCSLIADKGKTACGPGVMKKVARDLRSLRKKTPIIPLVKLYWKQETRNTTQDILHCMEEASTEKLGGFYLWYYSLIHGDVAKHQKFKLPQYDMKRIETKYRELASKKRGRR